MDPLTLGLIFGGVNMLKGAGQQKKQAALDEVDAKWAPFSGSKKSVAPDNSPWINDIMSLATLASAASGGGAEGAATGSGGATGIFGNKGLDTSEYDQFIKSNYGK